MCLKRLSRVACEYGYLTASESKYPGIFPENVLFVIDTHLPGYVNEHIPAETATIAGFYVVLDFILVAIKIVMAF